MENEKNDSKKETIIDEKENLNSDHANSADYYKENPNINKKNAITIIMPTREKFIQVHQMVEDGKKYDPTLTAGKLFLKSLDYAEHFIGAFTPDEIKEVTAIVEEARKEDPSFTLGKLLLSTLKYCQSQGFYIVNTAENGNN